MKTMEARKRNPRQENLNLTMKQSWKALKPMIFPLILTQIKSKKKAVDKLDQSSKLLKRLIDTFPRDESNIFDRGSTKYAVPAEVSQELKQSTGNFPSTMKRAAELAIEISTLQYRFSVFATQRTSSTRESSETFGTRFTNGNWENGNITWANTQAAVIGEETRSNARRNGVGRFMGSDVLKGAGNETANQRSRRLLPWVNYQCQPDVFIYWWGQRQQYQKLVESKQRRYRYSETKIAECSSYRKRNNYDHERCNGFTK